jgi:inhibitor of KinA
MAVRQASPPWQVDTVRAYLSVSVFYDSVATDYATASDFLRSLNVARGRQREGRHLVIPCCYELGPDLGDVAGGLSLPPGEVIRLHGSVTYEVYAIGFAPGFPYLGYLPARLTGVPRLDRPRARTEPGSVGLTGRQTAIYTLPTPGGWPLIGRTPLELVHVADGYFPLRAGDRVQFVPIGEAEFRERRGERLPVPSADVP